MIATLVHHPEYILSTEHVQPGYFFSKDNGCIYWAIQELFKSGIDNIDAFNLSNMLSSNNGTRAIVEKYNLPSMEEYIDLCTETARHTLEEYKILANKVVELAFKRELNKLSLEFSRLCFNKEKTLSDLNRMFYERLNELTEKFITCEEIQLFSRKVDDLWDEICSRRTSNGLYGIPSKFSTISNYLTYEQGELIVISARMKKGKSIFMMNEALHKIQCGVPTLYIDTEMKDRLFFERMLGNLTGIPIRAIKTGKYSYEEEQLLQKQMDWIKAQPFVHTYMPVISREEIYAQNKILKHKMDLTFTIFDYIKSNELSASDNYNALGSFTDFLKNEVAGELDLAMLAGTQLSRENKVADSDKIERYLSANMYWRNKTEEEVVQDGMECGNFCLSIALNRLGEPMADNDYLDFIMEGNTARIQEANQHKDRTPFD